MVRAVRNLVPVLNRDQLLSSWKIVERIHPDLEQTNREFNMALSQAYLEWALPTTSFILILTAMLGFVTSTQPTI